MSAHTKEQIAAAKAFIRGEETAEQREILREFDQADSVTHNAAHILVTALEAAEPLAEIGRLYVAQRKAALEYDVCDFDHAPTLEGCAKRYDIACNALKAAHDAYLAKEPKP